MHNPESDLENEKPGDSQNKNLVIAKIKKEKEKSTCQIVDCAVTADLRVKLKESEKRDRYLNLAWELKKNYGAFRTVT